MPLENIITPEAKATRITERYQQYETLRAPWKTDVLEVIQYVYATDTTWTTNNKNPWKNNTHIPKMCQIYDNLKANYTLTCMPKRKWLNWEANDKDSNSVAKRDSIVNYMAWCVEQPQFKHEFSKIIDDFLLSGNTIATIDWVDKRVELPDKTQVGYVGPMIRRISPFDIVFNPTADDFINSPKIVRTIMSMGELKEYLARMSNDDNRERYETLFKYLKDIRFHARTFQGDWAQKDRLYSMDGFSSFRAYLQQDYVEILTFYGDWYDDYTDTFEKNRVITVVDRHKLIDDQPNASYFGYPPIWHTAWRKKADNLWGMGPLANLVGMQYRLDHVENMRADVVDLGTYPVQKIKGFVEDYTWQPAEKIWVGEEGDVELVAPDTNLANVDFDLQRYENTMEQMAGAPKEAMGFRSPGEKTAYEVQRLENAASRIYQHRIIELEEFLEQLMNGMLEMARRNLVGAISIRVFDDDYNIASFQTLTPEDITGVGRIRPVGARSFAEKAQIIQNLTNLTGSGLWSVVAPHFSSVKLAKTVEEILDLKDYELVVPFVTIAEQAEGQMKAQAAQEIMHEQINTATGMGHDYDTDGSLNLNPKSQTPQTAFNLKREPAATAEPGGLLATQ